MHIHLIHLQITITEYVLHRVYIYIYIVCIFDNIKQWLIKINISLIETNEKKFICYLWNSQF